MKSFQAYSLPNQSNNLYHGTLFSLGTQGVVANLYLPTSNFTVTPPLYISFVPRILRRSKKCQTENRKYFNFFSFFFAGPLQFPP